MTSFSLKLAIEMAVQVARREERERCKKAVSTGITLTVGATRESLAYQEGWRDGRKMSVEAIEALENEK
jgi:hypothetical protein